MTDSGGDGRATLGSRGQSEVFLLGPRLCVDRRFLVGLIVLAIATRFAWVMWIHPPSDYVFSDMRKYVERAQALVDHGFLPERTMAWQAWGTHAILAVPLAMFGREALTAAAILWASMAALAVPLGYLLCVRVCSHGRIAKAIGIALLLWHPNLSNAGYFLSETPFLCFALASTLLLVVVLQTGRGAWAAGLVSAVAFAVRPQSAMFYALALLTWWCCRRRLPHVRAPALVAVATPLVAMLLFSLWRFHAHTGYWAGVAENANMNLTAGRCHNVVTQAFRSERELARSEREENTRDGRRVSLPNYRLAGRLPSWHPMALDPAFGEETIRFVGYIGDPEIHRDIRRRCYAKTGVLGQVRYSITNVMLSWFVDRQWPEIERGSRQFLPPLLVYNVLFQVLVWAPSLIGCWLALLRVRRDPALALVAWQLVNSLVVAAVFFGTIRLRTPYDPYAFVLGAVGWTWLVARFVAWRAQA